MWSPPQIQVYLIDSVVIVVTLNFFDDILIPADSLQHPSQFNEEEQVWMWQFSDGGGDDEESHDLFMDIGEEIRFRVINEAFTDTSPSGPEGETSVCVQERIK